MLQSHFPTVLWMHISFTELALRVSIVFSSFRSHSEVIEVPLDISQYLDLAALVPSV